MAHQLGNIHPVGTRRNHQTRGVFVIRFVAQITNHGQLFLLHLVGDLFQHLGAGHLVGQGSHNDVTFLALIHGTLLERPLPFRIHADDVVLGSNHLPLGGEVRTLDVLHQVVQ